MKQICVISDIDGTIADHKGNRGPFDETKVLYDKPIIPVIKLLQTIQIDYPIVFLSGRTEGCRTDTEQWITNHVIPARPIELYMRPIGDNRNDAIVKKEIYDTIIVPKYNVLGVFDDRVRVIKMWIENNIFVFDVAQGKGDF